MFSFIFHSVDLLNFITDSVNYIVTDTLSKSRCKLRIIYNILDYSNQKHIFKVQKGITLLINEYKLIILNNCIYYY